MKKIAAALSAILLVTGVKAQKTPTVSKNTTPQVKNNIKPANTGTSTLKTSLKKTNTPALKNQLKLANPQLKSAKTVLKASK